MLSCIFWFHPSFRRSGLLVETFYFRLEFWADVSDVYRYYEGKEFETSLKEKRPGDLSPELVEALSIPPLAPPPWLISMQRFGPPPSYPTLRIPGLNAPIPEG